MIISLPIIITLAVLLVLALVAPLFSPFRRTVDTEITTEEGENQENTCPPVSIILAEHDCSNYLKHVLPQYLTQDYPTEYQVIVVVDQSDTESEDYLKQLREKYPNLYYTLLPDSSRYVSRKKAGMTLGIKAAKYEWLLFADVNCAPTSDRWLAAVASHCDDNHNMVLGMTPYASETPAYYRFEHLRTMLYHLRSAQRGMAFSTNQSLLMIRRSDFFEQSGFLGNLEYARAEFEFLVNKFAKDGKCAIAIEPEARMEQQEPSDEYLKMKRLFAIDALKDLERAGSFKSLYKADLYVMHLFNFLTFIAVVCGVILTCLQMAPESVPMLKLPEQLPLMQYDGVALLGGSVLAWLISQMIRCYIYSNKLEYFESVSPLTAVITEWSLSLRNMMLRLSYIFADKNDFITHKL